MEICFKEDKKMYRIENIIKTYMESYRFLEPLYFVLKKFFLNTNLCSSYEFGSNLSVGSLI